MNLDFYIAHRVAARLGVILVALGFLASPLAAATQMVTNTAASGAGSLSQAVSNAAAGDTVLFNIAVLPATITLSAPLTISKSLNFVGQGPANTIVSGSTSEQILVVSGGDLNLTGLSLENGDFDATGSDFGAALEMKGSVGTVTATLCSISNNFEYSTTSMEGGAIYVGEG
ncbi:MAG: hypothetical protein ACREKE_00520, partial [bacterium]